MSTSAPDATPARTTRPRRSWPKRIALSLLALVGVVALVVGIGAVILVNRVNTYEDPWAEKVADAGYIEKSAQIGDVDLRYVEGPDNGTPLVLLHAQLMDWFDYSRVLPELAEDYHVFVVDYPGHGATTYPDDYPMTADRIGTDLGTFMDQVIGEPAYVSGNSSGGLLTLWLAANRPDMVKAIVLEDPPIFASEYPRITETVAIKAFSSSHAAVNDPEYDGDFLHFWLDKNKAFFSTYVFPGSADVLSWLVDSYRAANPGSPTEIGIIPNETVKLLFRGLEGYDPRFGDAFYEGTWNEGFDHAEALEAVTCPVLFLHANWSYTEDGLLDGALDQDDADRVMSLLADGEYARIDSEHVIHLEHPDEFVQAVNDFLLRKD